MRPFASRGSNAWLMATVAGGIVLDNVVLFTFGKEPRSFPPLLSTTPIKVFGAGVFPLQLVIPVVGLGVAAALALVPATDAARQGAAGGRAESRCRPPHGHQRQAAIAASFALSTALAGLAGLLIAPLFSVHSDMGTLFGIKAFAVAILGGIGSAPGVMLAGLIYGSAKPDHGTVRLQLHPDRHVHRRDRRACADAARSARAGRQSRRCEAMALRTAAMPVAILALTLAGLAVAVMGDGYTPFVLALVALATMVGVGLNILVGLTGQISIGHIGFYAIGAYSVGVLTLHGVNFWLALPAAAIIAGADRRPAGGAGHARGRALPRHDDHRLRVHRRARHDRVARGDGRPERPHEHRRSRASAAA